MASMTTQERALSYLERLLKAKNKSAELESILRDLDNLVSEGTNQPLDRDSKLRIIEALEVISRRSIALESIEKGLYESIDERRQSSTSASDNSDVLDVIIAMKRRVK